jgi:hypothetical protein
MTGVIVLRASVLPSDAIQYLHGYLIILFFDI